MQKSKNLAILILAAGTSSRLGEPKQLVKYKNKSLIWHACARALNISENVFVVLGAKSKECIEEIKDLDVKILINKEYKEGLSSSLKCGIKNLNTFDNVLIMLCDQPFIPSSHFKKLIEQIDGENIITSFYKEDIAVPAIFPKTYYEHLSLLQGDKGAKAIIKKNNHKAISLDDKYAFDIDTQEDKKLISQV